MIIFYARIEKKARTILRKCLLPLSQKYLINIALQCFADLDCDLQTRDPLSGFISAYGMSVAAGKLGKIFLAETGIYSFLFEIGAFVMYKESRTDKDAKLCVAGRDVAYNVRLKPYTLRPKTDLLAYVGFFGEKVSFKP